VKKQTSSQAVKYSKPTDFQEFKRRLLSTLQEQERKRGENGGDILSGEEGE